MSKSESNDTISPIFILSMMVTEAASASESVPSYLRTISILSESRDDRIAKTAGKKSELLMALKHPEVPLHNNESELGARAQVRRRDVSLHTMTEDGANANDTFLTIVETAKKLGVLCVWLYP